MAKTSLPRPVIEETSDPGVSTSRPRFRWSAQATFAALRHRNYRLWFYGQLVSLVGTWMQTTAQQYFVYELTQSRAYLGYVGFAAGVPTWLFMLYGGVIADRVSRRTLLILTQTSMMVLAFLLAGLTFSGRVQPWHLIAFAFLLGIANAFDAPTRVSFVAELVDREDLTNAIALNATMFNSATALGPAVSGAVYALLGPAWCFIVNGISFIAVIIALLMMRIEPTVSPVPKNSALKDIQAGFRYVASHKLIRVIIGNLAIISLFGMGFITLLPDWAANVLGGNEATFGLLQSSRGAGALIGALALASLGHIHFRGKLLALGTFIFPLLMLVFAAIHWLPLSMLSLVCVGMAFIVLMNSANALVQTQVRDDLRGRVMGIYTLTFFGIMPIGSFLAGEAAERLGTPVTVMIGALILLATAVFIWVREPGLREAE
jgi:MFS family permease